MVDGVYLFLPCGGFVAWVLVLLIAHWRHAIKTYEFEQTIEEVKTDKWLEQKKGPTK